MTRRSTGHRAKRRGTAPRGAPAASRRGIHMRAMLAPSIAALALAAGLLAGAPLRAADTAAAVDAPSATVGAPRASLLPLVQPLWSDLAPARQTVLAPFEHQWNAWSAAEKQSWLKLADRVPQMSPKKRERAEQRIREWATLSHEQRRLARQNYRFARRLAPDERQAQWERYREMTPEQRSVLRTSGSTSNTAARHAGARTGLARQAAQPLAEIVERNREPRQRTRQTFH